MIRLSLFTLLMLLALIGCDSSESADSPSDADTAAGPTGSAAPDSSDDALTALRDEIAELYARAEHGAPKVEVQHLLVSFAEAPRMRGVTRSKAEAEQLAADLMVRIHAGEDFDALIKEYTNDSHPGIYPMSASSRSGMVAAFGDVAWRLELDEFGVAPFHADDSPFGWHIIQRRE
jgi:parvulin-like peptidyl-prolyl isomerase